MKIHKKQKAIILGAIIILFATAFFLSPLGRDVITEVRRPAPGWNETRWSVRYALPDGTPAEGWTNIDGEIHYFDKGGHPYCGFLTFSEETGAAYEHVDGFLAHGRGRFLSTKDFHRTYYFDAPYGTMHTGWLDDGDNRYYFNNDGTMRSGWRFDDSSFYYLKEDGSMAVGWTRIGSDDHYFDENGRELFGLQEINGKYYFFDGGGRRQVGMVRTDEGDHLFLHEDGTKSFGWLFYNGARYYFDPQSGYAVSGFTDVDGRERYFSKQGKLCLGRTYVPEKEGCLYFYEKGGHAAGELAGSRYYGDDGVEIKSFYTHDYYTHNGKIVYFNVDYNAYAYGRFYVPDADVCVAIYTYPDTNAGGAQAACDRPDSAAALVGWGGGNVMVLADHNTQEFKTLSKTHEGTLAFISHAGKTYVYECYETGRGRNTGPYVLDGNGKNLCFGTNGDIGAYTCITHWTDIFTARFHLAEIIE